MGQRSQIYIVMDNIGKAYFDSLELNNPEKWKDKVDEYIDAQEKYENWVKTYGSGDKMIVGFYHQWMYGRSFVQIATMLFTMFKHLLEKEKYSNSFENPFSWKQHKQKNWEKNWVNGIYFHRIQSTITLLQSYISTLFDPELCKYTRFGIENFTLMNSDWETEPFVPFVRFDHIDNNDGVLIFDVSKNKFCFVGINNYDGSSLKYLVPIDAEQYIRSYYRESMSDFSAEDLKEWDKKDIEKEESEFVQNAKINKKFLNRLKGAKTLTAQDLIELFPEMENDIKNANNL